MKLEAEFKDLKEKNAVKTDLTEIVDEALTRLKRLTALYSLGTIGEKRYIIGSIYPEKWRFLDYEGRTAIMNPAIQLMHLINKYLCNKKTGIKISKNSYSGSVPQTGLLSNHFIEDLKKIATLLT